MPPPVASNAERALSLLRQLPRLSLTNLEKLATDNGGRNNQKRGRGRKNGFTAGYGKKGNKARQMWPPLGYEGGNSPLHVTTPVEKSYNYGQLTKRQYPPLSLQRLQLLIDTGRLNAAKPIDLAAVCNTKVFPFEPDHQHFGVHLTEEGVDCFQARVNIEVQWASEQSIAAVERRGGVITTAYFDAFSVRALAHARNFFLSGQPIPRRLTPPADLIGYYTDPANRGYLADPRKVAEERLVLAQKYGYELPENLKEDALMSQHKDPRQVFYGLEPGWVVSLKDKLIYKPVEDQELDEFYKGNT